LNPSEAYKPQGVVQRSSLGDRIRVHWRSPLCRWVLVVTLVFVVLVNLWGLRLVGSGIDYTRFGTVADWFTGLITIGTIIVAVEALRSDRRRVEDERIEREEEARRGAEEAERKAREDARRASGQVYSWLRLEVDPVHRITDAVVAEIQNSTPSPVYQWSLQVEHHPELVVSSRDSGPLLPGRTQVRQTDAPWLNLSKTGLSRTAVEFMSSVGESLRRDFDGSLHVISRLSGLEWSP
jgi:hypothetical protein